MTQQTFDRAAEDLGNSIHLEHVNVAIPDQRLASLFYGAGLGLTVTQQPEPHGLGSSSRTGWAAGGTSCAASP